MQLQSVMELVVEKKEIEESCNLKKLSIQDDIVPYTTINNTLKDMHTARIERAKKVNTEKTHTFGDINVKLLEEPGANIGSHIWISALIMSNFISSDLPRESLKDRSWIEIGAGTGIVGIVANLCGADVTFTDRKDCIRLLKHNVEINCKNNYNIEELTWGGDTSHLKPPYEFIVATDVVYNPEMFTNLIHTLRALSDDYTTIYLGYKKRSDSEKQFFQLLQKEFDYNMATRTTYINGDVIIFKIQRKKRSYLFKHLTPELSNVSYIF